MKARRSSRQKGDRIEGRGAGRNINGVNKDREGERKSREGREKG